MELIQDIKDNIENMDNTMWDDKQREKYKKVIKPQLMKKIEEINNEK